MGLESVEIVLELEKSFGIDIPTDDGRELVTPRKVVEYILSCVTVERSEGCRFQRTFFRIRRAFRDQLPALASNVRRHTKLKDILHKDQWPKVWTRMRYEAKAEDWPATVRWPGFFGGGPKTVGELAWYVALYPSGYGSSFRPPWTRDKVTLEVRRIIDAVLGKLDYSLDANFVKDLGMP